MQPTINDIKKEAASIREDVCAMLNWSEDEMLQYQHREGIAFIMLYLPCSAKARLQLESSKEFWGWWKLVWMRMDEAFFCQNLLKVNTATRRIIYKGIQAGFVKIQDVKPPSTVTAVLFRKQKEVAA